MTLLAKSHKNGGISLTQHSFDVAKMAIHISNDIGVEKNIKDGLSVISLLHDIGKCVKSFQDYIQEIESDDTEIDDINYINHNYIAWAFFHYHNIKINGGYNIFPNYLSILQNSILYHHILSDGNGCGGIELNDMTASAIYNKISEEDKSTIYKFIEEIRPRFKEETGIDFEIEYVNNLNTNNTIPEYIGDTLDREIPWRSYNDILSICKFCLISADRYVSNNLIGNSLSAYEMRNIMKSSIDFSVIPSFDNFDVARFSEQQNMAIESSKHKTTIVTAPAGYGKTILGLLWLSLLTNKKTYWVCPFNHIAETTYKSIEDDLKLFGFNKVSIGLLIANKWVKGDENCDIVITNIDNWLRPSYKNDSAHLSSQIFNANVVFDEFHEYVCSSPLFAAFITFMQARHRYCSNSKTLLLSATPFFLNSFWENINSEPTKILHCESHLANKNRWKIHFLKNEEEIPYSDNMLVMFNSIDKAQTYYVSHKNNFDFIIHSRYTPTDNNLKGKKLWASHNKFNIYKNLKEDKEANKLLSTVGTRKIGTGNNISFGDVAESVISPQHTIQCLCGRSNRFGEYGDRVVNYYPLYLKWNRHNAGEASVRNLLYIDKGEYKLSEEWYNFMLEYAHNFENCTLTLKQMYEMYNTFNEKNKERIFQYIKGLLVDSYLLWSKMKFVRRKSFLDAKIKGSEKSSNIRTNGQSVNYVCEINNSGKFITEPLTSEYCFETDLMADRYDFLEPDYDYIGAPNSKERDRYLSTIKSMGNWEDYFDGIKERGARNMRGTSFKNKILRKALNKETPFIAFHKKYNSDIGCFVLKHDEQTLNSFLLLE